MRLEHRNKVRKGSILGPKVLFLVLDGHFATRRGLVLAAEVVADSLVLCLLSGAFVALITLT